MTELASSLVGIAFHGLAYGMVLYLISVGLSVTMGLLGFINLAHGAFAMAGGLVLSTATARLGLPFPLALGLAFTLVAGLSILLERLLYRRLYEAGELPQLLFTMGLVFVAMALARLGYGTSSVPVLTPDFLKGQVTILGRDFAAYKLFVILFGLGLFGALLLGVERTRYGAMLRAAVDNRAMAQAVGINTSLLFTLSFALGSGLAGLGGALGADLLPVQWGYPLEHLVYFLIIVAVGGLGNLHGPFLAALLIGLGDTACKYWLPEFGAFFVYAVTIALLLWRPQGLFGVKA